MRVNYFMKLLAVLLFLLPFSLLANESIVCVNDDIQLNINVLKETVSWRIQVIDNPAIAISGHGAYQKELEAEDAFSSFDDNSAISYKEGRAVFVMGDDQSIYFPACLK